MGFSLTLTLLTLLASTPALSHQSPDCQCAQDGSDANLNSCPIPVEDSVESYSRGIPWSEYLSKTATDYSEYLARDKAKRALYYDILSLKSRCSRDKGKFSEGITSVRCTSYSHSARCVASVRASCR